MHPEGDTVVLAADTIVVVDGDMLGKPIDAIVLVLQDGANQIKPEAWITAYPIPYERKQLVLTE